MLRSLSNDSGDSNENGRRQKKRTLLVYHVFLYISLPSLQDYNVKLPIFTFCGGREHNITVFFSFSELRYRAPLEFSSRKIRHYLPN